MSHSNGVTAVAVGRIGGRDSIVTASKDGVVRIWDLSSHLPIGNPLKGHSGCFHGVAIAKVNGRPLAVTAGEDGTVRIWDLNMHRPSGDPLRGHEGNVFRWRWGASTESRLLSRLAKMAPCGFGT
ncbi:WD40 repeat domain-containing protein [Actinomadura fulvescens]|uniref:hypothetical protein n=1 Tax=Actinomadura fulvescens TaxID=46160 RepID=UPI00397E2419